MQESSLNERITRSLAYMLRHQPEEFDLELDEFGYADFEDVVRALNERIGEPIREEDVLEAIRSGDRPRYELTNGVIRALYGHSIEIDPGEPSEPPETLYIAVGARDAERAQRHGLRGGRRTFLHLALTQEEAEESGQRLPYDWVLVTVHASEADEDGVAFYDRQALFLSEHVPTDYLEFGESRRSGAPRGRGRGREGRGRREDGRGGDRRPRERRGREPEGDDSDARFAPAREERPARRAEPVAASRAEIPRPAPRQSVPEAPVGDFGSGIFEQKPAAPQERSQESAPKSKAQPAPAVEEPVEESGPSAESEAEGEGAFGSGIL